jgi:hypothetical protein
LRSALEKDLSILAREIREPKQQLNKNKKIAARDMSFATPERIL